MARMAIRVSGQRQKHGASLLGEIAKWRRRRRRRFRLCDFLATTI
jgi:uncharacterized protein YjiS (DUF1127 family)